MKKTVLVTGSSGFLGHHIAVHFEQKGWTVAGLDCVPSAKTGAVSKLFPMTLPDERFAALLQSLSPDLCVHAAGPAQVGLSVADPGADFRGAAIVTHAVLDAIRLSAPSCAFVYLSSAAVYGNPARLPVTEDSPCKPISPYGFHKRQCELICEEFATVYGLRTAALRVFSAYGIGLRRQVIWDICQKALGSAPFVLQGTGDETRDFVHASDIARAVEAAAEKSTMRGEAINVASGRATRIRDLAQSVARALGVSREARFDGRVPDGVPLYWEAGIERLGALGCAPVTPFEPALAEIAAWCASELAVA